MAGEFLIGTYVRYLVLEVLSVLRTDQHTLASARNVPEIVVVTLCNWDITVWPHGSIHIGDARVGDVWQSDVYWGSWPCFWCLWPRDSRINVELAYFLATGGAYPWLWMLLVSKYSW